MRAAILALLLVPAVAGCKTSSTARQNTPELTLVGEGLSVERAPLPTAFVKPERRTFHSLYVSNHNLFQDLRARSVGDVVTVTIDINDKAQFDNQSGRSSESEAKGKLAAALAAGGFNLGSSSADAAISGEIAVSARQKGSGNIDRSEKLHLSIAAVVTEVLPDGNLLVSGSQEVRVNHEVRVLNIAGIVRPLDIASDNIISYEKIAEARISYGGRGKISAVQ